MKSRKLVTFAASFSLLATTMPIVPAMAGGVSHVGFGGMSHSLNCKTGGVSGYHAPSMSKNISVYKPVNISKNTDNSKNTNVYRPVNISKNTDNSKNINVYKPVSITKNIDNSKNTNITKNIDNSKNTNITNNIDNSKNINITKNIDNSKNTNINKTIIINKGGGGGNAEAAAFAIAGASSNSSSSAQANVSSGSYSESVTINQGGGGGGGAIAVAAQETCHMTEASVVKAIHAVCMANGQEFPASHMTRDTWIESSYEGEVARCIPGATLRVTIGDMVQSDQGMAGAYSNGQVLNCAAGEAVRHYKDGMLKCARAVPVKDCTERTNLRLYGTADFFFSYRTQVCATSARTAETTQSSSEVTGMSMDGGVGQGSQY